MFGHIGNTLFGGGSTSNPRPVGQTTQVYTSHPGQGATVVHGQGTTVLQVPGTQPHPGQQVFVGHAPGATVVHQMPPPQHPQAHVIMGQGATVIHQAPNTQYPQYPQQCQYPQQGQYPQQAQNIQQAQYPQYPVAQDCVGQQEQMLCSITEGHTPGAAHVPHPNQVQPPPAYDMYAAQEGSMAAPRK